MTGLHLKCKNYQQFGLSQADLEVLASVIVDGLSSILPILGLLMLTLGLSLLGEDFPPVEIRLNQIARWADRMGRRLRSHRPDLGGA